MNSIRVNQGLGVAVLFHKEGELDIWYFYAEIWAFGTLS